MLSSQEYENIEWQHQNIPKEITRNRRQCLRTTLKKGFQRT